MLKAIDALVVAPEKKAEVYQKMAAKVRDIRQRFDKKRLTSSLMTLLDDEDPNARHEQLKDIATLEVVAKTLPPAIRGKLVGSFRQMDMLKSAKGREDYLIRLLPKIEQALENHLQNQFRMAIRREFDRGAIKVSESKTRGGKIGGVAHAIFEEARAAMKLKPEQAEATAEKLRDELENSPSLTEERLEELDGRIAALELFQDFDNADSKRLEEGLTLLKDVYRDGRREWLLTLAARRELRLGRIETFKDGLNMNRPIDFADRARAKRRDVHPHARQARRTQARQGRTRDRVWQGLEAQGHRRSAQDRIHPARAQFPRSLPPRGAGGRSARPPQWDSRSGRSHRMGA